MNSVFSQNLSESKVTSVLQERWYTAREAAEYLRTTVGSIHNMVYRKQLECFKRLGRLLFKKENLDQLIVRAS